MARVTVGRCPACGKVDEVDAEGCILPHVGAGNCRDTCYATGLPAITTHRYFNPPAWWHQLAEHYWPTGFPIR